MNNGMTPQKLGFFLVLFAIAAYVGFYLAISKAHAATELQPTARDWQRLNACAQYALTPTRTKVTEIDAEAIKCAAMGKAVSHIESAKGASYYAKTRLNGYGIRRWDKKGKPHIKTYKTTLEADLDFARIYFKFYSKVSHKTFATRWTGEKFIVKAYAAHLNKWVPIYTTLYKSIAK